MTLNSSLNRHEITFRVRPPGTDGWQNMDNTNLTYKVTALDDAGNIAVMASGTSLFTVIWMRGEWKILNLLVKSWKR